MKQEVKNNGGSWWHRMMERLASLHEVQYESIITPMHKLPDGSGFCLGSMSLPDDHWLYAPNEEGWDETRDCSVDTPLPILDDSHRKAVKAAIRWAVRKATNNGTEMSFDPDALVQNATYAICGPSCVIQEHNTNQSSQPTPHESAKALADKNREVVAELMSRLEEMQKQSDADKEEHWRKLFAASAIGNGRSCQEALDIANKMLNLLNGR